MQEAILFKEKQNTLRTYVPWKKNYANNKWYELWKI